MTKFDDFFAKIEPVESEGIDYIPMESCALTCQACPEVVEEGKWYMGLRLVVYRCSSGHKNVLENFG